MEPKLPAPNIEQLPSQYSPNLEGLPNATPERVDERKNEQTERRRESPAQDMPAVQIVLPVPQPVVTDDSSVTPLPVDDNPTVANDDDLIEKEWVDRAKKIIVETKDDPYKREQEVGKLQADYLKKRYGKELGAPE